MAETRERKQRNLLIPVIVLTCVEVAGVLVLVLLRAVR